MKRAKNRKAKMKKKMKRDKTYKTKIKKTTLYGEELIIANASFFYNFDQITIQIIQIQCTFKYIRT